MKQEVEHSYDKSRKACIGSTVVSIVGSTLTIIVFFLCFVTLGASLCLSIPGNTLASAVEIIIVGTEIGRVLYSFKKYS